jgi:hypothetical protein
VDSQNPTGYAQVLQERFIVIGPGEVLHTYMYGLERISENRQYFTGQQTLSQTFYFDYDGQARAINPSGLQVLTLHAALEKRPDEQLRIYKRMLELDPSNRVALQNLARFQKGQ